MLSNFKRVLGFAIKDFVRNKGISLAAIFVLTVTIMLVTGLFYFQGMVRYLTAEIQSKIDVAAYFKDGTKEQDILDARDQILATAPGVKSVEYTSKDQALAFFNSKHQNDAVLSQALQEVGANPFLPSLSITTNGDPLQYAQIADLLNASDFSQLIDSVDFSQKKDTIEKVYSITSNVNMFGIVLAIILLLVAVMVVFNTIKLAIESSKEEIGTMQAVGASDWFVRGPFMIQGIIYGIISFLICIFITVLLAYLLSPKIALVMPGFSAFGYLLTNWWIFVLIQLGFGVAVGAVSASIVVKKYLSK